MKVPFDWLKEYVDIKLKPRELADKLSMGGLEVGALEEVNGKVLLEVDILPNRGDCHSIIGVAREVSAITGAKFKRLACPPKSRKAGRRRVPCRVEDKDLCPRYMAKVIEGITIKESPEWLKQRLEMCGVRAINNVVDATNYVLLEMGQPMHAFDRLKIGQIIVRRAKPKETITTLDGMERKLSPDMLVIADNGGPIALAGVMGGKNTEVTDQTTSVVLESAFFNPISISRASKEAKLRTESSARFEKGVDWDGVEQALERCAALIAQLGGGKVLPGSVDIKSASRKRKKITLRRAKVNRVLGANISAGEIASIMARLSFKKLKAAKDSITVEVPFYRAGDIEREIDLVEEVARIYGYNKIKTSLYKTGRDSIEKDLWEDFANDIRVLLTGQGMFEAQTFSLVAPGPGLIKIENPLVEDESAMRSLIFPSLIRVVQHNLRHQMNEVSIFEIAKTFNKGPGKLPLEKMALSGAMVGGDADFFRLKGIVEALMEYFGIGYTLEAGHNYLHPGKSASLILGDGHLGGYFGALHPDLQKKFDLPKEAYIFELDLDALFKLVDRSKKFRPLPKYPKVERDISMRVPAGTSCHQILSVIRSSGGEMLEETYLFDRYKDSQAYRVLWRSPDRTLTDEEVNKIHQQICQALVDQLKVQLRK